ncbi:MAG TPA: ParB/RepB/Spo0J family partition protein [Alphaproteobacteria bacterium]|jgi:ParB family chromosome partitioning protein
MSADTDKPGAAGARPKLGRGLAALFGEESADYAELDKARPAKAVPIEFLRPGKFQPRQHFDQAHIQSLVDSIREKGILQPILVRRLASEPNAYEIVAGERRWRAAQLAQLHEVPVTIRELTDRDALEIALVENIQRENLNAMEEAEGYRRLMDEFKHTQEDLGRVIGKSRSHIANLLRLLSLPQGVRELVESGELSAGHARALIGIDDAEELAREAVKEGLSVRQVEALAKADRAQKAGKRPPAKKAQLRDANIVALERDLSNLLGLKVAISFNGKGGALTVHYSTLDQLDDVLRRMGK